MNFVIISNDMHPNEEIKRNNRIKKVISNSRAIVSKQIDFTVGCIKMKNLICFVSDIKPIEEIDLGIFSDFYNEMAFYPIDKERILYNQKYLEKLDSEIQAIIENFKPRILVKCEEIIEKLPKVIKSLK